MCNSYRIGTNKYFFECMAYFSEFARLYLYIVTYLALAPNDIYHYYDLASDHSQTITDQWRRQIFEQEVFSVKCKYAVLCPLMALVE